MADINLKMLIQNLSELDRIFSEFEEKAEKVFKPAAESLSKAAKDLNKIDYNTVQAIQAEKNGVSITKNKTVINEELLSGMTSRQRSAFFKKLKDLQNEQLRLVEEENKYRLKRIEELKRENDHYERSDKYKEENLKFKRDLAMGVYDSNRAFKSNAKGYFAQQLYRNSRDLANGNGALNNSTAAFISQFLGPQFGRFIGNTIIPSIGKSLRRKADEMNYDADGNPTGPKNWIGRLSRRLTSGGTKNGKGVNAGGGMIGLIFEVADASVSAWKKFNEGLIASASNLENLTAQLTVVTGSQGSAYKTFSTIKDYAFNSPYTTTQTTQTAVLLRQSGVLESNLDKTIRMLGDLGMGNQDRLNRISNNYAQILAAGRANSKDLREFANAGIPIYNALAKYFNKNTTSEVRKLAEEGKVTSHVIESVFQNLTNEGGTFHGASSVYAKTYSGQMNNLQDRLDIARGNYKDINDNTLAEMKKAWIELRTWFYEIATNETKVLARKIGNVEGEEDKKELGALYIKSRLGDKEVVSNEDYKKLTKKQKKQVMSISEYYEKLDEITKDLEGETKGINKNSSDVRVKGFYESFAKNLSLNASDYFESLYQNDTTFAHKLSVSDNTYKEKSDVYKVEKAIEERKKYLDLIEKYDEYNNLYIENINNKTSIDSRGGLGVSSFGQLYDFISSGFLGNSGRINVSYDKNLFSQMNANELKSNIGMFDLGVGQGFTEYGDKYGVQKFYDNIVESIEKLDVNNSKTIDNLLKSIERFNSKSNLLKNSKKVSDEYKKFLSELEQVISFTFLSGYSPNEAPKDYHESFRNRILRGSSGLNAKFGSNTSQNMTEILRKSEKALGSSVLNRRLANSTLTNMFSNGYLRYTGGFNDEGGINVDYKQMNEEIKENLLNMKFAVKDSFVNLKEFAEDLKVYNEAVSNQINVYTELEKALQESEDNVENTLKYDLTEAQQAAFTTVGSVQKNGKTYKDLEFRNGTLMVNTRQDGIDKWFDVFDRKNGFTIAFDELAEAINDSKSELLLLKEQLAENNIILSKVNEIRTQSTGRRFSNYLNNNSFIYDNFKISADRGSDFYKNIESTLSSVYSEFMNLTLPDLSDQKNGNNIAAGYMGGKYTYDQLMNIQNLQNGSLYWNDKTILEQLKTILGYNLKILAKEFKDSQSSYDDGVKWRQVFANLTGLSYEEIKKKGTGEDVINTFGSLQNRDIYKSVISSMADTGYGYSSMANLGVRFKGKDENYKNTRFSWDNTIDNIYNLTTKGAFDTKTMSGFKNGLESSLKSITELSTTLLTFTDTTNTNNKEITDVLKNYYVGNYLKGYIGKEEIDIAQVKDEKTGFYNFVNAKTNELIDINDENFRFEKEFTQGALDKLSSMTNAMLSSVKLLEVMKTSVESIDKDTREQRLNNMYSDLRNTPLYGYEDKLPKKGTIEYSSYKSYLAEAYNNARGSFIQTALGVEEATKNMNTAQLEQYTNEYNTKYKTNYDFSTLVELTGLLKTILDNPDANPETLNEVLSDLGFDWLSVFQSSSNYAKENIISNRQSGYKDLLSMFPTLSDETYSMDYMNRMRSGLFGVSDYEEAVELIARNDNPDIENLTKQMLKDAKKKLREALEENTLRELQDSLSGLMDNFMVDNIVKSFDTIGNSLREVTEGITKGGDAWKDFGKSFVEATKNLTSQIGQLMITAGLKQLIAGNMGIGLALLAAGGASQIVSGFLNTDDDDENEEKIKKLEALKSDLKDLIAQAKADAIYYEQNLSNRNALAANQAISVNDAIITPNGNVISTHPDDYLIATKTPGSLVNGNNSSPVVNLNIVNNSGQQLSVKQTKTESNGQINIEAIIEGVVGKGIAEGSFDGALSARESRIKGSSVYM